jgi:SpoVK/Ycf46/Vps4 family AAA+-type ATPase
MRLAGITLVHRWQWRLSSWQSAHRRGRSSRCFPLTCRAALQIGIDPPRGVLLYGPPGTGKTMLAKAVAHHTTAAFIRVIGSEFVQKYLGEGPRMVRDVFRLAKENAPAIIFIDEVDAIATARFDAQTGADREVQRILMELLNQMDGFDQTVNVKVIMATNRADTLDPALLRPGRLDRKIEFPLPDRRQKRLIFQVRQRSCFRLYTLVRGRFSALHVFGLSWMWHLTKRIVCGPAAYHYFLNMLCCTGPCTLIAALALPDCHRRLNFVVHSV